MEAVWPSVLSSLDDIDDRRYTEFSLHTEKKQVHDWRSALRAGDLVAYASRDFSRLQDLQIGLDVSETNEFVFVTNARQRELEAYRGWNNPKAVLKLLQ